MKVAIVHDWLVTYGGAERVLKEIVTIYPEADLFALYDFIPEGERDYIQNKHVETSFLQNLPFARKRYRSYLPFMPYAIEQFDLSTYDLIISSSHAVAHGVLTNSEQLHVSYFNGTMVYAWDMYHYYLRNDNLQKGVKGFVAKTILHYIRSWEANTANRVDAYIANSSYMSRRLFKLFKTDSCVIYPPVDVDKFELQTDKEDFFVVVSRLVSCKRIDIVIDAFTRMTDKKLIIIGDGPELDKLQKRSTGNIEFIGFQNRSVVNDYLKRAKAFIFTSVEPFGISIVEANACGVPVIALGKGAAMEILTDETGVFYHEQNSDALVEAVRHFESIASKFIPDIIRQNSLRFSAKRFRIEFKDFVDKALDRHFNKVHNHNVNQLERI